MIEKLIHVIWLSGEEKPSFTRKCMASWQRVLPDYRIREWSARDFDFPTMPRFVQQAVEVGKWAFASDYLRLYLLHEQGGIYLDSDVFMRRDITEFLDARFFSFMEYHPGGFAPYRDLVDGEGRALTQGHVPGMCMQAAFMGSEPGHPFLADCMRFYENRAFVKDDGSYFTDMIAPDILALHARAYGFRYRDERQSLAEGMEIFPSSYVAGSMHEMLDGYYAVHCCAGSWREYGPIRRFLIRVKRKYNERRYLS